MNQETARPRRSRIIVALMCILGAVFVMRLFYIQVIRHDFYENEALKEHVAKFTIPPKRGEIYARDGESKIAPMVLNEPAYTVFADPQYIKDTTKIVEALRRIAGGNTLEGFEANLENKERRYVVLARQLNKQQADLLKKEALTGVGLQEHEKRVYVEGPLAAQVLGFVNGEGKGQYGFEQGYDTELAGQPGQLKAVTDVNGIPISIGQDSIETPAHDGEDVVLSLDRNIQLYAEQALKAGLDRVKATRGSVVILNPNNGHILAMANFPTYDPRDYTKVEDFRLFQNAAISDPYEPGSVMKTLTMGVGLNEGTVQPDSVYNNTGSIQVADALIKNVGNELLGNVTMTQVLRYSYNTGVVHVLKTLGGSDDVNAKARQKLYQYFTDHYFLGRPTGVLLAGEASGQVIPPDDPQGGPVRYANMTFGQGLTTTVLQEATAFAAAINGGTYYVPNIISGVRKEDGTVVPAQATVRKTDTLSVDASNKLRQMVHEARAQSPLGRTDKAGYVIGGKTGTAQVYDPKTGKYSETDTIGSYLGFGGGQNKPEYVIMVRVDDAHIGDFAGSAAAAPIFGDISNWLLDYLKIQPKG